MCVCPNVLFVGGGGGEGGGRREDRGKRIKVKKERKTKNWSNSVLNYCFLSLGNLCSKHLAMDLERVLKIFFMENVNSISPTRGDTFRWFFGLINLRGHPKVMSVKFHQYLFSCLSVHLTHTHVRTHKDIPAYMHTHFHTYRYGYYFLITWPNLLFQ